MRLLRLTLLAPAGAAVALGALAGPAAAQAAAAGASGDDGWIVTLGARVQAVVPYEGAGHDNIFPVPVLQIRRPGAPDRPSFPGDALGVSLIHIGRLSLGPAGRLRGERKAFGDSEGLPKIGTAIEGGGFATWWPTEWLRLHADGGRGLTGHAGWVGDGAVDVVVRRGRWTVSLGPRIGFGDAAYMDTYFGLSPAQAAANPTVTRLGLSGYRPGGGRRYLGGVSTVAYRWSPAWEATANFSYNRLSAKAADSPVVRAVGSPDGVSGGVGLRYTFRYGG